MAQITDDQVALFHLFRYYSSHEGIVPEWEIKYTLTEMSDVIQRMKDKIVLDSEGERNFRAFKEA